MLDLLNAQTLQVADGSNLNWQKAITMAAQPLVNMKIIEPAYVESMISIVNEKGPYMNIGPQIVLAHARPDNSVHGIGLSLLKTNAAVPFVDAEHPVKLWFVLTATDSQSHLSVIQQLMGLLTDKNAVERMLAAVSVDELLTILQDLEA
ncbi:ascorbate-specific PTS system IIA component [Secundilactobacillus pentosiphilus]|uniref:Ascorbate-specific PTS system EIIA component n=1 Tax=Secundilactobacillus pentosiphilus TaxID=1714682 RepID=A0A1Z5IU43_9LACO|nr:PTS sugar transporter subunit IIA [Secundilactobacillus pentosiphilus]GAX05270.1 ascorbate-specific PTS system IIA component [Secundilactobacillus pentosiphilus]